MKISDVYRELSSAEFARSQLEFSEIWLGRSKRYYSHLLAEGREPGIGTLIALEGRLRRQAGIAVQPEDRELLRRLGQRLRLHIETRGLIRAHRTRAGISTAESESLDRPRT
ncbi:DUF6626 family protein [Aurantimonas coralicida]|uniref:DUF6626 family protein n=1 Tax=Aurantimonas coralicida TaxID=182270 RepID=UPI0035711E78